MAKITGIGGIFFKTDTVATRHWLADNLGLETESWGRMFPWRERDAPERTAATPPTSDRARATS